MEVGGIGAGNPSVNLYGVHAARNEKGKAETAAKSTNKSEPTDVVSISREAGAQRAETKPPVEAAPKAAKPEATQGNVPSVKSALRAESGSGDTDNDGDGRGGRINVRV